MTLKWEKVDYPSDDEFEVIQSVKTDEESEALSRAETPIKTETLKTREESLAISTSGNVKQDHASSINVSGDSPQPSSQKNAKSVQILCFPYVNRDATFFKTDELTHIYGLWTYRRPECEFTPRVIRNTKYNGVDEDLSRKWKNAWKFRNQLEERSHQIRKQNQGFVSPSPEEVVSQSVTEIPELAWRITQPNIEGHSAYTKEWIDEMYKECEANEDFDIRHLTVKEWRKEGQPVELKSKWEPPVNCKSSMAYHTDRFDGCSLRSRETHWSIVTCSNDPSYYLLDKSGKLMKRERNRMDHNRTAPELRSN